MQEGLYKVEFHTVHGTGNGVLYATSGKLRGGNSGFAFIGNYARKGDEIHVKISTLRHNPDLAKVGRLTLGQSLSCVRLVLWDETARRLISFRELRTLRAAG